MPKGKPTIPARRATAPQEPRGILELDRFSEATLSQWSSASQDLDELSDVLHFGIEPERRRLRPELLTALQATPLTTMELSRWTRVVTYQYSLEPLSSAGSLKNIGGRFNAGVELDANTLNPWPALYLAEDYETAFREKFQMPHGELTEGLTPQELALEHGADPNIRLWRLERSFNEMHTVPSLTLRLKDERNEDESSRILALLPNQQKPRR